MIVGMVMQIRWPHTCDCDAIVRSRFPAQVEERKHKRLVSKAKTLSVDDLLKIAQMRQLETLTASSNSGANNGNGNGGSSSNSSSSAEVGVALVAAEAVAATGSMPAAASAGAQTLMRAIATSS